MKDRYDFSEGQRGKHHRVYHQGSTLEQMLSSEKPEIVAVAKKKAAAILKDIALSKKEAANK